MFGRARVVIPRKIEAKEVQKTKRLPQVAGWPYARSDVLDALQRAARYGALSLAAVVWNPFP